jgi:transmembrane sensor
MNPPSSSPISRDPSGAEDAAQWLWRLDRGLTATEQDAFGDWLQGPGNAERLQQLRQDWKRLDLLADWRPEHARPNPDLLAPPKSKRPRQILTAISWGLAACLALVSTWYFKNSRDAIGTVASAPQARQTLPDSSIAKLDGNARIEVEFTEKFRRIRLLAGRAFFIVEPDSARPFIVETSRMEMRAVGTAFEVTLGDDTTEVLVAEGVVAVAPPGASSRQTGELGSASLVQANQNLSAVFNEGDVPFKSRVATLGPREMQQKLEWQHGLITFERRQLSEIVEELNWLNETKLVLLDTTLAQTEFSGTIRSDNIDGFVRLLSTGFNAEVEQKSANEIQLRSR